MDDFERLVRYETALWHYVSRTTEDRSGVGLGTLLALRALQRRSGEARVQEVSDEIGITVSAASKLVDRLERDGLVCRSPNPNDRRSSLLTVTEVGAAAAHAGTSAASAALVSVLPARERRLLQQLLERLEGHLHEANPVNGTTRRPT